ncbi:MAG: hypothetical protein J0J06_02070 [Sphingomonas sp.]|uniref:hypothetical protein n=1 Tax=Sphingomonas sp. TaxID=28214 RepID=UPI001ACACD6B|nr:hypothetical protein [Sphingomonas sp.]MBN8814215.1 hypothetical protein [Sphingomonas sp.]
MRRTVWASAGLLVLAGCGGGADAVGENSTGSVKTTAVGEVVANIATPTPTPTPTVEATDTASNAADAATDAVDAATGDSGTTSHDAM